MDYYEFKEKYGNKFKAEIGAAGIKPISELNVKKLVKELRADLGTSKGQKRLKIVKRLRILESEKSGNNLNGWFLKLFL